MSFAARLIHDITLVHVPYDSDIVDDYNQPAAVPATSTIRGLVQPRPATREMGDTMSAGSEIADHVIFLSPMDLNAADYFVRGTERFEIVGIRRFDFGRSPHLEVDCRRVTGALASVGS